MWFQRFNAAKCHWSGGRKPAVLEVLPYSLNQLDPNNGEILAEFEYRRIGFICRVITIDHNFFACQID